MNQHLQKLHLGDDVITVLKDIFENKIQFSYKDSLRQSFFIPFGNKNIATETQKYRNWICIFPCFCASVANPDLPQAKLM